jgi:spermidine synthase
VSGGVLLALEIVASRVIAPYFGNSVYVWGSLIGVFLAALSAGYYLGGRISTRWPHMGPFLALVFLAGAATYPIPHFSAAVLGQIATRDFGPRGNPLLGSIALFFIPSAVMATISPYAVRLRARSVEGVGDVAGRLYALSTLGSIGGTLLAAFVLISTFGVRSIVQILGATEMGLAVVGLAWTRRVGATAGAAAGTAAVLLLTGSVPADAANVIRARDTVYHRITVSDEGQIRYLRLDNYWQSARDRGDPLRTVFDYTDYLHLPILFNPGFRRVLFVGMGGGTAPSRFYHDYPNAAIEVVEIDPAVVETARTLFALPDGARLQVHVADGRLWLRRTAQRYDLVILDAYLIDTIPFHLATREFFQEAAARLAPGGVLASNVIGAVRGPESRFFRAIYKTLGSVFPHLYVFPVGGGEPRSLRNIILVGTTAPALTASDVVARAAAEERAGRMRIEALERIAGTLLTAPVDTRDVPVLTDDYAPTDALIAPAR